jgi:hypothetical protein
VISFGVSTVGCGRGVGVGVAVGVAVGDGVDLGFAITGGGGGVADAMRGMLPSGGVTAAAGAAELGLMVGALGASSVAPL